jgi:outer membrane protein TolC
MKRFVLAAALIFGTSPPGVGAQDTRASREPLQLAVLQREAHDADARARETALLARQSELRVRNIEVERLPSVGALGQTQYQSDVPTAPFSLPNGQPAFAPPKFTYDASLRVDQRIFDPSVAPRIELAHAELAESQVRVRTALFALRAEVNEAFFTAALTQEQIGALSSTIDSLEGRLSETNARVREGTALAGEAAAIEATILQHRQRIDDLRTTRSTALARLGLLTGRAIDADATLALPELDAAASRARAALQNLRERPEYEQFDRTRDRVARQQQLAAAADRPQLSAFGRVGYGRPGLNFINDQPETYGLAGLQLQWKAWTWSTSDREREALAIQQSIVGAEEQAFTSGLRRLVEADLAAIDRLQRSLSADDRIVTLREEIDREAKLRLQEGVTTAADYLDRNAETLGAQFDRARHRVELAQARARLLTTLGLEVQ